MPKTLKAYWQDLEDVVESPNAQPITLSEALDRWADGRGVAGNYFGLIDENDRAVQFYFFEGIPDTVEDARCLRIVLADFPIPAQGGSFTAVLSIEEHRRGLKKHLTSAPTMSAMRGSSMHRGNSSVAPRS